MNRAETWTHTGKRWLLFNDVLRQRLLDQKSDETLLDHEIYMPIHVHLVLGVVGNFGLI